MASRIEHGRAFGKVILLGEHAVVYGSPAIAVALTVGATATAQRAPVSSLSLGSERFVAEPAVDTAEPLPARAFRQLLLALGTSGVAASAELELPAGAGLGASAALGVALARAVLGLLPAASPGAVVARAALAWEQVFHGNASGIDTAAAEHGGCLWFTRQAGPSPLSPAQPLSILAAQIEPGQSTRLMVEGVAERRRVDPGHVDTLIQDVTELVQQARVAITSGDVLALGRLMNLNHRALIELGVSTPELNRAVDQALNAGALGAKLTGAGGGGCAIALVDARTQAAVLDAWQARGYRCWWARTGG